MNRKIEYRTFSGFEIHSVDADTGIIEGYASLFNKIIPYYNERVMPGAFAKTLQETGGEVPILDSHNPDKQIGWGKAASEDKRGLRVSAQIFPDDIPEARKVWVLSKAAAGLNYAKMGLSIGFSSVKEDFETIKGQKIRNIREVKLHEYSPVAFPANVGSGITNTRSVNELAIEIRRLSASELDSLLEAVRNGTSGAGLIEEPGDAHSDNWKNISKALDEILIQNRRN